MSTRRGGKKRPAARRTWTSESCAKSRAGTRYCETSGGGVQTREEMPGTGSVRLICKFWCNTTVTTTHTLPKTATRCVSCMCMCMISVLQTRKHSSRMRTAAWWPFLFVGGGGSRVCVYPGGMCLPSPPPTQRHTPWTQRQIPSLDPEADTLLWADKCENTTLSQTSFAGGNKHLWCVYTAWL